MPEKIHKTENYFLIRYIFNNKLSDRGRDNKPRPNNQRSKSLGKQTKASGVLPVTATTSDPVFHSKLARSNQNYI